MHKACQCIALLYSWWLHQTGIWEAWVWISLFSCKYYCSLPTKTLSLLQLCYFLPIDLTGCLWSSFNTLILPSSPAVTTSMEPEFVARHVHEQPRLPTWWREFHSTSGLMAWQVQKDFNILSFQLQCYNKNQFCLESYQTVLHEIESGLWIYCTINFGSENLTLIDFQSIWQHNSTNQGYNFTAKFQVGCSLEQLLTLALKSKRE